jgi:poly-gamma-glutamate capsule biosynthesis protein CapA/YwtB (metallophosphatase superfamily)
VDVTPAPSAEDLAAERQARLACERISIAAVGDIMLGTDYPEMRLPADDGRGQMSAASAVLKAADVAFGNVEGVLMDGGEAVKVCKDPSACYLFRSPARYARTLADAGFTVVSLANNHARDFGEEGRSASMRALEDAGVRHSGRQGDIASWTQGGLRLAMIAFSPFSGSWPMLDEAVAAEAVRELAASHDIVIVSFHGGGEGAEAQRIPFTIERYYGENRGDVVQFARSMIDAGADLVIGHGPHVPRAMELYRGRLVAYSLGNFATWYGISVTDAKGYAPILTAELDGNGELVAGAVVSMQQERPDGPRPDKALNAWRMIQRLTALDFPEGRLELSDNGDFRPGSAPAANCETR